MLIKQKNPSPNMHMLIKLKSPSLPRNLTPRTNLQIAISILNKSKSAKPSLFNSLEVFPSASDIAKLFMKKLF